MKKTINKLLCYCITIACIIIFLNGCNGIFNTDDSVPKYDKISFNHEYLGENRKMLTDSTDVVKAWGSVDSSENMSVYRISPRKISEKDFKKYAEVLGISEEIQIEYTNYNFYIRTQPASDSNSYETMHVRNGNEFNYSKHGIDDSPLTIDDDVLIKQAETILKSLEIEGEFEYNGISSKTSITANAQKYVCEKGFCFVRKIDNRIVYGEERVDISFNQKGITDISFSLYDYTKINTIEMLSLDDAFSKIKNPDNFYAIEGSFESEELINVLTLNNVSIGWINYYNKGYSILQPVYLFQGMAETKSGNKEIIAQIIAIPEKYLTEG